MNATTGRAQNAAGLDAIGRVMTALGGVATRGSLLRSGISRHTLSRAVRDGYVESVRQGWYAIPGAEPDVVAAVRVGGMLTSVSATRRLGIWTLDDNRLHVAVPVNASRLRAPVAGQGTLRASDQGVCIHWRSMPGALQAPVAATAEALMHVIECQSPERAVATLDSALNMGVVTLRQLRMAAAGRSARYRRAVQQCDTESQSGTESLVRFRLRRLGIRVRSQVFCDGVGRVDLLVGDRLAIECDSRAFHGGDDAGERDYDRDLVLIDGDYLVLRLRYRHVVYEWPRVEAIILGLVRRNRHLNARRRVG